MKKKYYLTLDTETATLPFADSLCQNAKQKQTIAIAKPLVYDIGWTITDRKGEVVKEENYLIQETFFVPNVFNTAYYKDKRPIYMDLLKQGKIKVGTWNEVAEILLFDLKACDYATAYNACFDFKKAIPFTERYIKKLYSSSYTMWEEEQKAKCKELLRKGGKLENSEYLKPVFKFRGEEFPIVDLWGVACERLINNSRYKDFCLENKLLTVSATYFKTSAETSFQYLMKDSDFTEDHTALSDAQIEAQILTKALKKGRVEPSIVSFPFRNLGTTYEYVKEQKPKYKNVVADALDVYIDANNGDIEADLGSHYWQRILSIRNSL